MDATTRDPAYRWVIVAAGGLMGCAAMGALFSLPVLLNAITTDTGWSRTGVSFAMTLAFLAMPTMLFGSYMADQRLPIALFLMLLGFGRLDTRDETVRLGFVLLVVAFTAIRIGDLTLHWRHLAQPHAEFREALQKIDRGKILLVAYAAVAILSMEQPRRRF